MKKLKWFFEVNGGISGAAAKIAFRDGTTRRDKNNGAAGPIQVESGPDGVTPKANTAA